MTQGRIGGPMLKDNLVRNGVDLAFETNLIYIDVNNLRVGINQSVPTTLLDVNGTAKFGNIQASTNTIASADTNGNINLSPNGSGNVIISSVTANRVVYAGTNKELLTSANLTFDGTTLTIATGNLTTLNAGNIQTSGNTIASSNTNGNINLSPNGTGNVLINTATSTRIFYAGSNKELTTNANLTFSGTLLTVTGNATITGTANAGNLRLATNTLSSTNTDGNITLSPNGTGNIIVNTATANRVFYSGTNKEMLTSPNLTFDGTTLTVNGAVISSISLGNIDVSGNTISSINTNGNINLDPNGTGKVAIIGTNAVSIPSGSTSQRPSGVAGDIRVNTENSTLEFFDGVTWVTITGSNTFFSDSFNGDGSTTVFTLSQSSSTVGTLVSLNGVIQIPITAYTVSGTTLTFTEAPAVGDVIDARVLSTSTTVLSIADGTTKVDVNDTTQNANVTIHGNLVLSASNAGVTFYKEPISSVSSTSVGTSATTIDSFAAASYSAAKYVIYVSNGSNRQVSEVLLTHNGTTPYMTTYAVVFSSSQLMTFTSTISGGNVLLQGTGAGAGNTVKVSRHLII